MTHPTSIFLALALAACGTDSSGVSADDAEVAKVGDADVIDVPDTTIGLDADVSPDAGETDAADSETPTDMIADADAGFETDTAADAEVADAAPNCLQQGHAAGARYSVGDHCNFCDCQADGTSVCTARSCGNDTPECSYNDVEHGYGERFPATDGCNECVCAASGLACTRRCAGLTEEGAILLESLDESCGDDPTFTPSAVLTGLPMDDINVPFAYRRDGTLYPETLPDTTVRVRVVYERGFAVCRLPSPTQPAIDMEVAIEWMTADGAFDEGLHTYLRRNNFGFVDAWTTVASTPVDSLDGSFDPNCLGPQGFGFSASFGADGTLTGSVSKICEVDLFLEVGGYSAP